MRGIVAKTTAARKVFEGVRPDRCAKDGKAHATPSGRRRWCRTPVCLWPSQCPVSAPVRASGARQAPAIVTAWAALAGSGRPYRARRGCQAATTEAGGGDGRVVLGDEVEELPGRVDDGKQSLPRGSRAS